MSALVIKDLPPALHARLKERAQQNHRSLTKEALALLEQGVLAPPVAATRQAPPLPPLVKLPGGPLTLEAIEAAIDEGRD